MGYTQDEWLNYYFDRDIDPEENVYEWYVETFPDDDCADDLDRDNTFNDIYERMQNYEEIYSILGDNIDSIIRERVMAGLEVAVGVEYDKLIELIDEEVDRRNGW